MHLLLFRLPKTPITTVYIINTFQKHISPNPLAIRGVVMHVQSLQGTQIHVVGNGATEAVVVEIPDTVGRRDRCGGIIFARFLANLSRTRTPNTTPHNASWSAFAQ